MFAHTQSDGSQFEALHRRSKSEHPGLQSFNKVKTLDQVLPESTGCRLDEQNALTITKYALPSDYLLSIWFDSPLGLPSTAIFQSLYQLD